MQRCLMEFSAKALKNNYKVISKKVPHHSILPMIKANAYGHGTQWVAEILKTMPGLFGFGVASLDEGRLLRESLAVNGQGIRILVFSGCVPWRDETGYFCKKYNLTPVLCRFDDFERFINSGWFQKLSYELKFNTGMNRLGINVNSTNRVVEILKKMPGIYLPQGVCSHLAQAEKPGSFLSKKQKKEFINVHGAFDCEFNKEKKRIHFHLANSGAIWNAKAWELEKFTSIVRPGISIYGARPWFDAKKSGLIPVMSLKAKVIERRKLMSLEAMGYGGLFKVKNNSDSKEVALLAVGYGDGIPRMLGCGRGFAYLSGEKRSFLGIVSMDISAVSTSKNIKVGDFCEIWGRKLDPWLQSVAAHTIPYELFTSMTSRVERIYK